MMEQLQNAFNNTVNALPDVLAGILLIIVAWIVAALVRRGSRKGMEAAKLDERFQKWGVAQDEESARGTMNSISQALYYLVWVLFLPGIFQRFGLTAIAQPISNMISTALEFIPNLIGAALLLAIGLIVGRFLYNLVYNFSKSLNLDRMLKNLTSKTRRKDGKKPPSVQDLKEESRRAQRRNEESSETSDGVAKVLATIAYILVFIPILTVALEALEIETISRPIVGVLDSVLSAIPNVLLAVILLVFGIFIAKIVGDLVADLLASSGLDTLSRYLKNTGTNMDIQLSSIVGGIVTGLIALFIAVEALNVLNLDVLNAIGTAIIAYLPNIIFAIVILALGFIGGQILGNFISQSLGSRWLGGIIQFALAILAVFMAFDQLQFASTIVNTAFMFIIGGISVAFAIAFGIGGREFASKQLDKLDSKLSREEKEIKRNLDDTNDDTFQQ